MLTSHLEHDLTVDDLHDESQVGFLHAAHPDCSRRHRETELIPPALCCA